MSARGATLRIWASPTRYSRASPATADVPGEWPSFSVADIRARARTIDLARTLTPFVGGEIDDGLLARLLLRRPTPASATDAVGAAGADRRRTSFVLELFHGPTLAFKDVAMQLLARLMDHALAERGERATIVGRHLGRHRRRRRRGVPRPQPHRPRGAVSATAACPTCSAA